MLQVLRQLEHRLAGTVMALLVGGLLLGALAPCVAHASDAAEMQDMTGEHGCPHCMEAEAGCAEQATDNVQPLLRVPVPPSDKDLDPDSGNAALPGEPSIVWPPPAARHDVRSLVSLASVGDVFSRFCRWLE